MTALAVPLTEAQIRAAERLHGQLSDWRRSDAALYALNTRLPDFDSAATLVKVVMVNALYGTNVYAVMRMAAHVEKTLADTDLASCDPELVETLAALPPNPGEKPRRHYSFASKFAHFFIDAERFPILDQYAERMVRLHLGRANCVRDGERRYVEFATNFQRLKELVGWSGSCRSLDRYLWLAGLYHKYEKNSQARIGVEVRRLFEEPPKALLKDLSLLGA